MNQPFPETPSFPLSRRSFLQFLGLGAVAGLLGYSRFSKPQPTVFQPDSLELPYRLGDRKTVVVVGGGLAGLACAYELSQRGFAVTLLERDPQLGGKIASWSIQVGEQTFQMEHGFHGFFPQYYNLNRVTEELDIRENFRSLEFYSVMYRGDRYQPEVFRPSHSAFPWNIVDLAISSTNRWRWGLNLAKPAHWKVFSEITGFHPQKSFQRLDSLSVAEWVAGEFPQGLYDLYFLPFAKSSLNAPDLLSAGELMQFFHFYFFGNPEGLAFYGTRQDMGRSLVQPIANAIADADGQILTDVTVSEVKWQQGQIAGLNYQSGGEVSNVPRWVPRNLLLTEASQNSMEYFGAGDAVFVAQEGGQDALSLTCPHRGCTVSRKADGSFQCPCHGAQFDANGRVTRGPAQRDLTRYRVVERQADRVQLVAQGKTTPAKELNADYYVFAADVPGVQQLLNLSTGDVAQEVQMQIEQLAIADPFAVCRFWFDRDFDWEQSDFTSLSGYALTDSITPYHRIQEEYIARAAETGGSVVELHSYGYKETEFPTQEAVLTTFEAELYEVVPALKQATRLHRELVNQKNFSGFPPNSYANRPTPDAPVDNLAFAGDWVKMPFPCSLMERAVSSGLLAANVLCQREGLQGRPLLSVNPQGVLAPVIPAPGDRSVSEA